MRRQKKIIEGPPWFIYDHVYWYVECPCRIVSNHIQYHIWWSEFLSDQTWYNISLYEYIYMVIESYAIWKNKCTPVSIPSSFLNYVRIKIWMVYENPWSYIYIYRFMITYRFIYFYLLPYSTRSSWVYKVIYCISMYDHVQIHNLLSTFVYVRIHSHVCLYIVRF